MDNGKKTEDKSVEAKIKRQLDCLNSTSERINRLENEINTKRNLYRTTLSESTRELNLLSQNLGDCIAKSRPYYDAKKLAKEAQNKIQEAALNYDSAVSCHAAAREMVSVAEHGMHSNPSNTAWVEVLNHANEKINEAEKEKFKCGVEHKRLALEFKQAEDEVGQLQSSLKTYIKKSRPYFELKRVSQEKLEKIIQSVKNAELKMQNLKETYSNALRNLELISNTLHALKKAELEEKQRFLLGKRQEGVGAESQPNQDDNQQSDLECGTGYKTIMEDLKRVDSVEDIDILTTTSTSADDETVSFSSVSLIPQTHNVTKTNFNADAPNTSSAVDDGKERLKKYSKSNEDLITLTSMLDIDRIETKHKSRARKKRSQERRMKKIEARFRGNESSSEND